MQLCSAIPAKRDRLVHSEKEKEKEVDEEEEEDEEENRTKTIVSKLRLGDLIRIKYLHCPKVRLLLRT